MHKSYWKKPQPQQLAQGPAGELLIDIGSLCRA